jgi:hypothetical protein
MKTVVWDVDDVLCPLMRRWYVDRWVPEHMAAPGYEALTENPPHRVLGVDLDAYHASLDGFRRERYAALPPDPAVRAWFASQGARHRHVALTATPRWASPLVASWVLAHFGDWIRTFAFVPSPRPGDVALPGQPADKAAWLRDFGRADVFLDDRPDAVAGAREAGVDAWLVRQPWNDGVPIDVLLGRL